MIFDIREECCVGLRGHYIYPLSQDDEKVGPQFTEGKEKCFVERLELWTCSELVWQIVIFWSDVIMSLSIMWMGIYKLLLIIIVGGGIIESCLSVTDKIQCR